MEPLLTTREIATHLGVSPVTIFNWIRDHNFPRLKAGRMNRFRKVDVDEWIAQRTLKANSEAALARNEHPRLSRSVLRRPVSFTLN